MLLDHKVAIITGGTRGIGFATVQAFLAEGAQVILCGSRPESAQKAVEKLKGQNPAAKVEGISPDLLDAQAVKAAFDAVVEKYGKIDILINNAGVSENTPFPNYTTELFDRVMNLNVKALMHCAQAAAIVMIQQKSGVILNTSSMVSLVGQPSGLAYPASKFAVNGITLSLARELGPKGIRVNAVAPGVIETDMMRSVPKEQLAPLVANIPLRRIGQPEDIANAFVFLASDKASYITGVVLSVDGLVRP